MWEGWTGMTGKVGETATDNYRPGIGIMLLNRAGRVFVARRIEPPDGSWQMPQGGIDAGETPREAALRELKEEIGTDAAEIIAESTRWLQYDLPENLIGKAWGGNWRGQRQKWFVMRFTGSDRDINLNATHPEFSEWKWVSVDQLPELAVSFQASGLSRPAGGICRAAAGCRTETCRVDCRPDRPHDHDRRRYRRGGTLPLAARHGGEAAKAAEGSEDAAQHDRKIRRRHAAGIAERLPSRWLQSI